MGVNLLYYRPWRENFRAPAWTVWPVARMALRMLLRRRLFWVLLASGLLIFLMFFFGQFLLDWAISQIPGLPLKERAAENLILRFRRGLSFLSGNRDTFRYFFGYQGTTLIIMLTLAGSVLVGNDFTFGSLPFYLSKPLGRWHYVLGKCLAVGIVVNLMTTLPALVLYVQYGFGDWDYFLDPDFFRRTPDLWARAQPGMGPAGLPLLLGILGYGLLLTVVLSVMLVATASWLRRTMPMVMVWVAVFLFLPLAAEILARVGDDVHWRLLNVWNDLCLVGNTFLTFHRLGNRPGPQPELVWAALTLGAITVACLIYLNHRTRAVDVVR